MENKQLFFKEDINFLEYPNWVLDCRTKLKRFTMVRENGKYEMVSPDGLPNHFDKIVLYSLMYELLNTTNLESREINTTAYKIAKSIFDKEVTNPKRFARIRSSLIKWSNISINFEGVFYEGDEYTTRSFHVLDDVIFNHKSRKLLIRFNEQYLQNLRETKFYKFIDFTTYKKLSRSISARLYEILVKSFKNRSGWNISIAALAEKLTLDKRDNAKDHYPSDVLSKLKPAILEINEKTNFKIDFEYEKKSNLCLFKKINKSKSLEVLIPENTQLLDQLITLGISKLKSKEIVQNYSQENILRKFDILKQNQDIINNGAAWLIRALEENWEVKANIKHKEREQSNFIIPARTETSKQYDLVKKLEKEHIEYLENKAQEVYKVLPAKVAKEYDKSFTSWLVNEKLTNNFNMPDHINKIRYLIQNILDDEDTNFDKWIKKNYPDFKQI